MAASYTFTNAEATSQASTQATTTGASGDVTFCPPSSESWSADRDNEDDFDSNANTARPTASVTVNLTRNNKKKLMEFTTATRAMFLNMSLNDRADAAQNELPFIAIRMYAFFERNLMHFSKHHKQHLTARSATRTIRLVCWSCFVL
ncbi:unnamed protein product [Phytophthora fragariaefolia]|uniref:Unnamed protein product n=1 Tax=Phytophthora fragariaefolia TaxID=1490495 RepID=A0A9W6XLB7_9STRA|nr:unnamed protein product [Phytophthora fragariaefolia]